MFFTVFAFGSNGGIFSTVENILSSLGIISTPVGDFSEALTSPYNPIQECGFNLEIFSNTSSGHESFFATI